MCKLVNGLLQNFLEFGDDTSLEIAFMFWNEAAFTAGTSEESRLKTPGYACLPRKFLLVHYYLEAHYCTRKTTTVPAFWENIVDGGAQPMAS